MTATSFVSRLDQAQDIAFSFYTKECDDLFVSAFAIEETIFGMTRIEVKLVSDSAKVDLAALMDEPATLTVHHRYLDTLRHFSGIVAETESGDTGHHKTAYCPPQARKPLVDGPQIAHVVGPQGEEIYTDEHGRMKVHFPWGRHTSSKDSDTSCWIRVASSWAGATWGNISIPRIGQEVIVEFMEGDPDQPIITGRTYHAGNKSPYPLPANKTRMVIRSDTHKSGIGAPKFNEISFEDENGEKNIFVHAQKDQTVKVLNDKAKRVEANEVQSIGQNRSMEVSANAQEKIGGSLNRFIGGGSGASLLGMLGPILATGMKDSEIGSGAVGTPLLSQFVTGAAASTVAAEALSMPKADAVNKASDHYFSGGTTMAGTGTALGMLPGSIMPFSGVANTVIEKFQTDTVGIARS